MKKKKILIFGSLPSGFGGMETVFKQFYNLFNNEEFETHFFMYSLNKDNNTEWLNGIDNASIYYPNSYFRIIQKYQVKTTTSQYIKEHTPSLIISYDCLSIYLAREAIKKSSLNIELYSWNHSSINRSSLKYQSYFKLADEHLALCPEIKKQLIKIGIPDSKIHVIYNPIRRKKELINKSSSDIGKFLYVGRIEYDKQKNMQELFYGLSKLDKPFELNIIGNGNKDDIDRLKSLAIDLKINEKIIWHGWQKDPWQYVISNIKGVSALILTSNSEGLPMILLEAISYGVICISSNCKTGPEDVINKNNGFIYQMGNIDELANCLLKSYENKKDHDEIKQSINYAYDENYYENIKNILI